MGEGKEVKLILEEERRREILNKLNLLVEKHRIENILAVMSWAYKEDMILPKNVPALIFINFPELTEKGRKWLEKQKIKK